MTFAPLFRNPRVKMGAPDVFENRRGWFQMRVEFEVPKFGEN